MQKPYHNFSQAVNVTQAHICDIGIFSQILL